MAVVVYIEWPNTTKEQYDKVRKTVNWEGEAPTGGLLHIAAFDDEGTHIVDLWETPEDMQRFVADRLTPGVMEVGITTQPDVKFYPVHAVFNPGIKLS